MSRRKRNEEATNRTTPFAVGMPKGIGIIPLRRHFGPRRPSSQETLKKALGSIPLAGEPRAEAYNGNRLTHHVIARRVADVKGTGELCLW